MTVIYPVATGSSVDALKKQLSGSKLLIPSISIGNVPQLSADLLIHNLDLKLVARLDALFLYPFASPVDYVPQSQDGDKPSVESGSVSTGLELYHNEALNLSVIQQRSPILPGYSQNFLEYLINVIQELALTDIILLDSNDTAFKGDVNFEKPFELYTNDLTERFKSLKVSNTNSIDRAKEMFTTFPTALITEINKIKEISLAALLVYVYEGDNFYDAQVFTREALELLQIDAPKEFIKPKSWEGVYGDRPIPTSFEDGLFG